MNCDWANSSSREIWKILNKRLTQLAFLEVAHSSHYEFEEDRLGRWRVKLEKVIIFFKLEEKIIGKCNLAELKTFLGLVCWEFGGKWTHYIFSDRQNAWGPRLVSLLRGWHGGGNSNNTAQTSEKHVRTPRNQCFDNEGYKRINKSFQL